MNNASKHRAVVVGIMLLIAVLHLLPIESILQGKWLNLYFSFFSDIVIPFGAYFLISMEEPYIPMIRHWWVKLAGTFLVPAVMETLQYFGIPALGSTFDPLDYIAYGIGAVCAALVDTLLFPRIFAFWKKEKFERQKGGANDLKI